MTTTRADSIDNLRATISRFVCERHWESFQTPKNLAMAMIVEAAELVEEFQWLTEDQSLKLDDEKRQAVSDELADVLIYLIHLADSLEIDLLQAAHRKARRNTGKYPVETPSLDR